MFDPLRDKKLEERDENVPPPSLRNKTDRKIIFLVIGAALVLTIVGLIVGFLVI